ncbi:MAG: nitroreductase family deazaflavin-dependent oxidoreductase [Chloroflexota bacterium]
MNTPNNWNQAIINEFRANAGKVGGNFAGSTILLLHTTGAKSGQERINPVVCLAEGDRYIIFASKAGAPTHPDWYHNLVTNSLVTVEFGAEKFQAQAAVAAEPERSALFKQITAVNPGFGEYQAKTTRVIPVIILTRMR